MYDPFIEATGISTRPTIVKVMALEERRMVVDSRVSLSPGVTPREAASAVPSSRLVRPCGRQAPLPDEPLHPHEPAFPLHVHAHGHGPGGLLPPEDPHGKGKPGNGCLDARAGRPAGREARRDGPRGGEEG